MASIVNIKYHYLAIDKPSNILCFDYADRGSKPDLSAHVVSSFLSKEGYNHLIGRWKIKYKKNA